MPVSPVIASSWVAQATRQGPRAQRQQLSRARPCPQPACSFVAQQAAAAVTEGLALGRATDCKASGNTRATCMWQNMLQSKEASCLLHYGKADCIALALVTTGHSLCGTTSHRECAKAIGWAHLTYAQQSDIWQLVTFLPHMLKGFVSLQCGADPAHRFPLQRGTARVPAALVRTFRHCRFLVLRVLLAALCGLSVSKTLATSWSLGTLRNTASLNTWLRWTPSSAPLPLLLWVSIQFYSTMTWNKLLLNMFTFSLEPLFPIVSLY